MLSPIEERELLAVLLPWLRWPDSLPQVWLSLDRSVGPSLHGRGGRSELFYNTLRILESHVLKILIKPLRPRRKSFQDLREGI